MKKNSFVGSLGRSLSLSDRSDRRNGICKERGSSDCC